MTKEYEEYIGKKVRVLLNPLVDKKVNGSIHGESILGFGEVKGNISTKVSAYRVLDGILEEETEKHLKFKDGRFWYDITDGDHQNFEFSKSSIKKDEIYLMSE